MRTFKINFFGLFFYRRSWKWIQKKIKEIYIHIYIYIYIFKNSDHKDSLKFFEENLLSGDKRYEIGCAAIVLYKNIKGS